MKELDVSNKNLTNLDDYDLSEVEVLYCSHNNLTSLPPLPNVKELWCNNNNLTSLPELPNVEILCCDNNNLTTLPELPNVKGLYCWGNNIFYSKEIVDRFGWNHLFSTKKQYEQWHEDYDLQQKINNFLEL